MKSRFLSYLLQAGFFIGMTFLFCGLLGYSGASRMGAEALFVTPVVFVGSVGVFFLLKGKVANAAVAFVLFLLLVVNIIFL